MEHIYFEARLCSGIATLNGKSSQDPNNQKSKNIRLAGEEYTTPPPHLGIEVMGLNVCLSI